MTPVGRLILAIAVLAPQLALIGTDIAFAPQASATPVNCVNNYGSLFDGVYSAAGDPSGGTFEGASAVIINNSAPICDTGSTDPAVNFVYTWTMIHQNNNAPGGANNGYAQAGFFRGWNSCNYFTTESDQNNNQLYRRHVHMEYGCLGANTSNNYWVQYVPSTGLLRMNVDNIIMDTTTWNPYANWNWGHYGPFRTEFNAETKYLGSDVPTTNFSSMQVQSFNDAFTNTLPQMYHGCPWPVRYVQGPLANNFFAIQTFGSASVYNPC